jgi:Fe-S-cluster-containing hydrogenase component 2
MAGNIRRDDEKCYQCGACTGICPTGALALRRPAMEVIFAPEKCTACGLCVSVCPARAMEVSLNGDIDLAA